MVSSVSIWAVRLGALAALTGLMGHRDMCIGGGGDDPAPNPYDEDAGNLATDSGPSFDATTSDVRVNDTGTKDVTVVDAGRDASDASGDARDADAAD
jgi:hypothetical protein